MICPECSQEVAPKDRYCGHCRWDLERKKGQLQALPLAQASPARRWGSRIFDAICTFWGVKWLLGLEGLGPQLLATLVAVILWVTLVERLGQRSPGQRIFSLQRVGRQLHWVPE